MHIIAGQHTPIIAGQSQWSKIGAPMQQIDIVRKKYPYTGQAHGQKDEKIKIQQQRGNLKILRGTKKKGKAFSGFGRTRRNSLICFFPAPLVFHHRMTQSKTERTTPVNPYERSYPFFLKKEIRRHIQVLPRDFRKYETTADFRTEAPYTYSFTMICSPSSATW